MHLKVEAILTPLTTKQIPSLNVKDMSCQWMIRAIEPACYVINKKLKSLNMSRIFLCICKAKTCV